MTPSEAFRIHRAMERGADLTSLLLRAEARERAKVVKPLYSRVPSAVLAYYRRQEREAAKARQAAARTERERIAQALLDPHASEREKLLARIGCIDSILYNPDF